MPETTIPAPPGFSQLSKAEQVRSVSSSSMGPNRREPRCPPVPESHLNLVEQRLKRYRDDPSPTHAAVEVLDRLSNKST
jgi:hypothetical protein